MKNIYSTLFVALLAVTTGSQAYSQANPQSIKICRGSAVVLKANPTAADVAGGYVWYRDGAVIGGTNDSLVITQPGKYTLASVSSGGCNSTISSALEVTYKELIAVDDRATAHSGTLVNIPVTKNDIAECGSIDFQTLSMSVLPKNGSAKVSATEPGVFSYTPNASFVGTDSFTYTVYDVAGNVSNVAKVLVEVTSATPLALDLLAFNVSKVKETQAAINWQVIEDNTEATFTIERSSNATSFEPIGTLKANTSSISQKADYSFTDTKPLKGTNYYRLKISDNNGKVNYSNVKMLSFSSSAAVAVYPNPATTTAYVKVDGALPKLIQLLDLNGRVLQAIIPVAETVAVDMNQVSGGLYLIRVTGQDDKAEIFKIEKR
ncbi:MAG: T9SS type A sorting domain-containing protein [Sphingobacteriales bacterium]|nr:MAG: T9SS type A sorting domain-containing protein [Sphingobacteriales bacterium]